MTSPNSTPSATPSTAPTAKHGFTVRPKWIALLLAVLVIAYLTMQFPIFKKKAELGSAYAAQVGCSCHFMEGRSIPSCEGDLEEAAWMVSMTADDRKGTVTGSVPVLASRTAQYDKLMGCQLLTE